MAVASKRSTTQASRKRRLATGPTIGQMVSSKVAVKTRDLTVKLADGSSFTVTCDPSLMDLGWQTRFGEAGRQGRIDIMAAEVFGIATKWNLRGEDGKVLPITQEHWSQIPTMVFVDLLEQIENLSPKNQTSTE